jgi:hypothetical protein
MKTKTYLITCVAVTVVVGLTLLFVPAVSDTVEGVMLAFLATYSR